MVTLGHLIAGKTVAIVGPSSSIVGSAFGEEIESHDFVARLNHQWPISKELERDVGRRMDLLFHCCNGDFPVRRLLVPEFNSVQYVCFEDNADSKELLQHCRVLNVPAEDVSWRYRELTSEIGSPPNTGLVAICHLLNQPIARLSLFGMTFFKERYYTGYLGDGAAHAIWQNSQELPDRIWKHDLRKQFEFFTGLLRFDSRISVDARSMNVMQIGSLHQ